MCLNRFYYKHKLFRISVFLPRVIEKAICCHLNIFNLDLKSLGDFNNIRNCVQQVLL